jgi:hypothetical protein
MGNGALPHGPSYRADPRLYLKRPLARPQEGPLTGALPTRNVRGEFVSPLTTGLTSPYFGCNGVKRAIQCVQSPRFFFASLFLQVLLRRLS